MVDTPGVMFLAESPEDEEIINAVKSALEIFQERKEERMSVWQRSGLIGQTVMAFSKLERALIQVTAGYYPNKDHYKDAIVYCCFALTLLRRHERGHAPVNETLNGDWPWQSERNFGRG